MPTPSVCTSTSDVCMVTSKLCSTTPGVCMATPEIRSETPGICTATPRVFTPTRGLCTSIWFGRVTTREDCAATPWREPPTSISRVQREALIWSAPTCRRFGLSHVGLTQGQTHFNATSNYVDQSGAGQQWAKAAPGRRTPRRGSHFKEMRQPRSFISRPETVSILA